MNLEDYFMELGALLEKPAVILCHRGVMDASAYISEETWQIILDEQGWSAVNLRDRRYDAVLHLVSAADGAVEYFLKRNKSSTEDVKFEAIIIQIYWKLNEKGFKKKMLLNF